MLYLNNEFIDEEQAQIKTNDRGFLLADGLFETLRCYQGKPFALQAHWQRLAKGAEIIKLSLPLDYKKAVQIIKELLTLNKLLQVDAGVRITITRGNGPPGPIPPKNPNPTVLISCFPIAKPQLAPLTLTISEIRRNEFSPLCQFKSLCYLENILARQAAVNKGFDDAILLNTKNAVACVTTANLFFVKDNKLYTPSSSSGALLGITRQIVLELAKDLGIETHEKDLSLNHLLNSDELFITNSIVGIRSVMRIDNTCFNDSSNTITSLLKQAFSKITQEERNFEVEILNVKNFLNNLAS